MGDLCPRQTSGVCLPNPKLKQINKHMKQEERKKRLEELRIEYADPNSTRSKIGIELEAKLLKIAIESGEKL